MHFCDKLQLKEDGTLVEQLRENLGKPVPMVVYNARSSSLRGVHFCSTFHITFECTIPLGDANNGTEHRELSNSNLLPGPCFTALIELTLVPSTMWGGAGLLGVSIRFCSFENATENIWHVLVC